MNDNKIVDLRPKPKEVPVLTRRFAWVNPNNPRQCYVDSKQTDTCPGMEREYETGKAICIFFGKISDGGILEPTLLKTKKGGDALWCNRHKPPVRCPECMRGEEYADTLSVLLP